MRSDKEESEKSKVCLFFTKLPFEWFLLYYQNLNTHVPKTAKHAILLESTFLWSVHRATYFSLIWALNIPIAFGQVRVNGHPCQKQPSTKTATFLEGNAMSIFQRRNGFGTEAPCPKRLVNQLWLGILNELQT